MDPMKKVSTSLPRSPYPIRGKVAVETPGRPLASPSRTAESRSSEQENPATEAVESEDLNPIRGTDPLPDDLMERVERWSVREREASELPGAFREDDPETTHDQGKDVPEEVVQSSGSATVSSIGITRRRDETEVSISTESEHNSTKNDWLSMTAEELARELSMQEIDRKGKTPLRTQSSLSKNLDPVNRVTFNLISADIPAHSKIESTPYVVKSSKSVIEHSDQSDIGELTDQEKKFWDQKEKENLPGSSIGFSRENEAFIPEDTLISAHIGTSTTTKPSLKTSKPKKKEKGKKKYDDEHTFRTPSKSVEDNLLPGTATLRERTTGSRVLLDEWDREAEGRKPSNQISGQGYLSNYLGKGDPDPNESSEDDDKESRRHPRKDNNSNFPKGGGGGPPDSDDPSSNGESGSDSSHSESSDGSNEELSGKAIAKLLKIALKSKSSDKNSGRAKTDPPEKWDGEGDYTRFEHFMYDLNHYFETTRFPIKHRVKQVGQYLEGRAKSWFITTIAPRAHKYTVKRLGEEMFDQFLPTRIRSQFRDDFNNATQEDMSFKQFVQHVKNLASRVPDISERQIVIRVWFGAHPYLRRKWNEYGLNPEVSSIKSVEISGERFEISANNLAAEKKQQKIGDKKKKPITHLSSKAISPSRNQQQVRPKQSKSYSNSGKNRKHSAKGNYAKSVQQSPKLKDLTKTKEEINNLRAAGKCFICEQTGHIARDCKAKKVAKPPHLDTNNIDIRFEEIDEIHSLSVNVVGGRIESTPGRSEIDLEGVSALRTQQLRLQSVRRAIQQQMRRTISLPEGDNWILTEEEVNSRPYGNEMDVEDVETPQDDRRSETVDIFESFPATQERQNVDSDDEDDLYVSANESEMNPEGGNEPDAVNEPEPDPENEEADLDDDGPLMTLIPPVAPLIQLGIERTSDLLNALGRDPEQDFMMELYNRFIWDLEELIAPENTVSFGNERGLRWYFESSRSHPHVIYLNDISSAIEPLALPRSEIEDQNVPFKIATHIMGNYQWRQSTYPYKTELAQVMEMIQDSFAQKHQFPIAVHRGVTGRDRFKVVQMTSRKGYYVFDRLRFPGHWIITNHDLHRGLWSADNIFYRHGKLQNRLYAFHADDYEINNVARHLQTMARRRLVEEELRQIDEDMELGIATVSSETTKFLPGKVKALTRTASKPKDSERKVPKYLVVTAYINGHAVRALIDSGSLADFVSTTVSDQLGLKLNKLAKPIPCTMAASGSRTMIQYNTAVHFKFQQINETRTFDVMNLENWDMILGTPFMYQHAVMMGLNPPRLSIGSIVAKKMEGDEVSTLTSLAADVLEGEIKRLSDQLRKEASDLCRSAENTPLPPMRDINHTIPLIDPTKVYRWRPSRCPEAIRPFWNEKRDKYIESGRWRFRAGRNASPMMIIPKKDGPNGEKRWRTVIDKREINANTRKLTSPLPNMETILSNVLRHKYRSLIDGKDAYEQIRVEPNDVPNTLFNTPDGTMESLVLQQGDCNGGATYQALMNHIFGPYIGKFMDVYLDDILIYSNTIEEHVEHLRIVFKILREEKLYLTSPDKLQFFAKRLTILGHVIDNDGLVMDPHKVDSVLKWKVPTSRELLASFLGAVGFLAPDCKGIRIPMAVLTPLTGSKSVWKWTPTEQRAFEQVKNIVDVWREHRRKPLKYGVGAPNINLVCDASLTGAGGLVSQGNDVKKAQIVAFWSAKFSSAQQNYPVHDRELLAIVESLKRFKHLLLGTKFFIWTDHKPLKYLGTQANLSARQHRWIDVLAEFDYILEYLPGDENTFSDALSRIYSNEAEGTVRAPSEFIQEDDLPRTKNRITAPLYTGGEVKSATIKAEINEISPNGDNLTVMKSRAGRIIKPKARFDSEYAAVLPLTKPVRMQISQRRKNAPKAHSGGRDSQQIQKDVVNIKSVPQNTDVTQSTEPENFQMDQPDADDSNIEGNSGDPGDADASELAQVISRGESLINFPDCLKSAYKEDSFFKLIVADSAPFQNFSMESDLIFNMDQKRKRLCIPDAIVRDINIRELVITQAHSLLAHMGYRKTLEYIRESMWWPTMVKDIKSFCESCQLCATSKTLTQKPMGLLRSLEIPQRPWQVVGFDFVGPLPTSINRHGEFDRIAVFIDHLTAMVHLVPARTNYKVKDIAELVFDSIYKYHGLPDAIVSDRDSLFTSEFWKALNKLIGIQLRMSTAYHPESDGTTERMNRTVGQMLRQCISSEAQDDWVTKLPYIEFAINSAKSEITGYTPFFLNTGRSMKTMVFDLDTDSYRGVKEFAMNVRDAIMEAHDSVLTHRVKQTILANRKRRTVPFEKGDLVYLSTENLSLPKGKSRKLSPKYIGPFTISEVVVPHTSFRLDLPINLKNRSVHNVFHAKLLRPHIPNDDRRFPGRALHQVTDLGTPDREWEVNRIIAHNGYGSNAVFEVEWKTGDKSWMDYPSIRHLTALEDYLQLNGADTIGKLKRMEKRVDNIELDVSVIIIDTEPIAYIGIPATEKDRQRKVHSSTTLSTTVLKSLPYHSSHSNMVSVPGANSNECAKATWQLMQLARGEGPGPTNLPPSYNEWARANNAIDVNKILANGFRFEEEKRFKERLEEMGIRPDAPTTAPPPPPVQVPPIAQNWSYYDNQRALAAAQSQYPGLIHPMHQIPPPLGYSYPHHGFASAGSIRDMVPRHFRVSNRHGGTASFTGKHKNGKKKEKTGKPKVVIRVDSTPPPSISHNKTWNRKDRKDRKGKGKVVDLTTDSNAEAGPSGSSGASKDSIPTPQSGEPTFTVPSELEMKVD